MEREEFKYLHFAYFCCLMLPKRGMNTFISDKLNRFQELKNKFNFEDPFQMLQPSFVEFNSLYEVYKMAIKYVHIDIKICE